MGEFGAALGAVFYHPLFLFIWGACWGSFLNVVMYRFPLGQSVITPPSACPNCKTLIKFYDNIPVLSWFILGGKCRSCKKKFSMRYALNEAFIGGLCAAGGMAHPDAVLAGLALGHIGMAAWPTYWLVRNHRRAPIYLVGSMLLFVAIYVHQVFFS